MGEAVKGRSGGVREHACCYSQLTTHRCSEQEMACKDMGLRL